MVNDIQYVTDSDLVQLHDIPKIQENQSVTYLHCRESDNDRKVVSSHGDTQHRGLCAAPVSFQNLPCDLNQGCKKKIVTNFV